MADEKKNEHGGGKFPNRAPDKNEGLAIEEFVDDDAVNQRETPKPPPGSTGTPDKDRSSSGRTFEAVGGGGETSRIAGAVESAFKNPLLLIATAAAIPLLLVFWGVSRHRSRRDEE